MRNELPSIRGAGIFCSKEKLPGVVQTQPRVVQTYELELFIQDGGESFLNGARCPIRKGLILLARPGDVRYSILPTRCRFIHFTTVNPAFLGLLEALPPFAENIPFQEAEPLFLRVREAFVSADEFAPVALASRLGELLWQLRQSCVAVSSGSKNPVRKAVRLIQRDFAEPLTVEQMAAACNLSVSYFHKLFVQETGVTPNHYLMISRLSVAKSMLLSSDCSVAQIAESCGFSSQGYFCDCMKKYTGMSPRQFRRAAGYPEES